MRRHLVLLALLPVLAVLNYSLYERETLRRGGELVLLELAPADPRSLMQGDYMRLRYEAEQKAGAAWKRLTEEDPDLETRGPTSRKIVLSLDDKARARFDRFHREGEVLAPQERLLSFRFLPDKGSSSIRIEPQSFFFQEGHGDQFSAARFGMMHLGSDGDHLLVGLANEALAEIRP
nr:GDYXXLXY domain-containing protein [uncultured Cohaesibacter sp.]